MKNIHILPTTQPSRLAFDMDENFYLLCEEPVFFKHQELVENRNIYITSSEEIKEGDWFHLDMSDNDRPDEIHQMGPNKRSKTGGISFLEPNNWTRACKKIILTTDPTLIADGIQAIDNEFLEWFVKNPTCEFVEIIYLGKFNKVDTYKIIIPSKQESYICPHTKIQCDDECCVSAEDCHITSSLASGIVDCEEPKQDCTCGVCNECEEQETIQILNEAKENALKQSTLEEAAEKHYIHKTNRIPVPTSNWVNSKELQIQTFIEGANWQAERMYSEEELKIAYNEGKVSVTNSSYITTEEWFEQFKKK